MNNIIADNDFISKIIESWTKTENSLYTTQELNYWVQEQQSIANVKITQIDIKDDNFWFIDKINGTICNKGNNYFYITGIQHENDGKILQHPIIIQEEIGYLGIICKEINGIIHFLMQAKIEPGNLNYVQISPTIQATKSNFLQKHGGKKPYYIDYFLNACSKQIIYDQIQSEQSSRFYKKRNRNCLIFIKDELPQLPDFKWMTLKQIKEMMNYPNLVNMDTRTVLSCIPISIEKPTYSQIEKMKLNITNQFFFNSIFNSFREEFIKIYNYINDQKMFWDRKSQLLYLNKLDKWHWIKGEFVCYEPWVYKVIFCDINIKGREINHWSQPMFKAEGRALFCLITQNQNGVLRFLVHIKYEPGCFDCLELGPTYQIEAIHNEEEEQNWQFVFSIINNNPGWVIKNVILSEEGGRFYHEENYNIILEIPNDYDFPLKDSNFWVSYNTLNQMVQYNNILNIQLRNLLVLMNI